ncbi:hypothetical protein CTAYLR_000795 [Chrysophaeum taylorii]|uniref:Glycosyl transferase family 1 domain-containing protein n=1 Tax=Chrysophaeum taylorii TaxID=2483200 RepID=A0AAD7XUW2_9STRA|nr:hypothetical protein CTAYLR_000795 [Chrysophaeum taylorii]
MMTAAAAAGKNVSVEWHAPFFSGGGYCSEATTFAVALDALGVDTYVAQHGDGVSQEYIAGQRGNAGFEKVVAISRKRKKRTDVAVCHSEPGAWHVLRGPNWPSSPCPPRGAGIVVGRTMFETDRLPDGWVGRLNAVDEVWVPTEFHRAIFSAAGTSRVSVVGEPVDVDAFRPDGRELEVEGSFVVASVFKWEKRKGWDVLLAAWRDAWARDANCDAQLVLVANAYHSDSDFRAKLDTYVREDLAEPRGLRGLCPIRVASDLSQDDLESLYRRADLLAAPSRGEGWGRPHVEAMASGTPIVATNWSGPTAYLTNDNGYPLAFRPDLVRVGDGPFRDHMWAEPDVDHLAAIFRRARDFPDERRAKGARARADMVNFFSPRALALVVADRLDDLLRRRRDDDRKQQAGSTTTTTTTTEL